MKVMLKMFAASFLVVLVTSSAAFAASPYSSYASSYDQTSGSSSYDTPSYTPPASSAIRSVDTRDLDDQSRRWELGVQGAFTNVESGKSDTSGWIGGNVYYGLQPWSSAGVEAGYTSTSTENGVDYEVFEFMVEVTFKLAGLKPSPDSPFSPYGLLGIGRIWTWTDANERSGDAFAWKMGGGFNWHLNKDWATFFEVAYHQAADDIPITGNGEEDTELNFWTFGGGLKRFF